MESVFYLGALNGIQRSQTKVCATLPVQWIATAGKEGPEDRHVALQLIVPRLWRSIHFDWFSIHDLSVMAIS